MRAVYDRLKINAELAPFFSDLPARLASSHLIVSRSGAGTVAELAAIGRPSILVPLPGSIDQDQFPMPACWPRRARFGRRRFYAGTSGRGNLRPCREPARLNAMAASARTVSGLDAAERLADLVLKVAESGGFAENCPCHAPRKRASVPAPLI